MNLIVKLILCYLLGSVSGSMLIGKLKGIDIREMGSGNAGSTNAFRTIGTTFALGVLFIDVLKGFVAVKYVSSLKLGGILTTNTIDNSKKIKGCKKIEIISLAPIISEAMKRIANSTSVSSLFK